MSEWGSEVYERKRVSEWESVRRVKNDESCGSLWGLKSRQCVIGDVISTLERYQESDYDELSSFYLTKYIFWKVSIGTIVYRM